MDEPRTIPEARNAKTGVSVRYVVEPGKSWYVFRASYGREDRAAEYIVGDGMYAYVAKRQVVKHVGGKVERSLESLLPNLVFAYVTGTKAEEYVGGKTDLTFLSYYYNHLKKVGDNNPPLTVPVREMESFILATCGNNEHVRLVRPEQCHYRGGEMVRVVGGMFMGVEGRVARVAGQQRVVVALENIGLISTAYIPTAFLQTIG